MKNFVEVFPCSSKRRYVAYELVFFAAETLTGKLSVSKLLNEIAITKAKHYATSESSNVLQHVMLRHD